MSLGLVWALSVVGLKLAPYLLPCCHQRLTCVGPVGAPTVVLVRNVTANHAYKPAVVLLKLTGCFCSGFAMVVSCFAASTTYNLLLCHLN
jgi:hypothetical protein